MSPHLMSPAAVALGDVIAVPAQGYPAEVRERETGVGGWVRLAWTAGWYTYGPGEMASVLTEVPRSAA